MESISINDSNSATVNQAQRTPGINSSESICLLLIFTLKPPLHVELNTSFPKLVLSEPQRHYRVYSTSQVEASRMPSRTHHRPVQSTNSAAKTAEQQVQRLRRDGPIIDVLSSNPSPAFERNWTSKSQQHLKYIKQTHAQRYNVDFSLQNNERKSTRGKVNSTGESSL